MSKEFITCDMIRDAALKLVYKMHTVDGFVPDVIYDSLRGGAYMANVMSEYYKLIAMKEGKTPVFYAAVVARSYGDVKEHSSHVDIDGWTWSPKNLKKGQKILIVDDIFDTGMTVNALVGTVRSISSTSLRIPDGFIIHVMSSSDSSMMRLMRSTKIQRSETYFIRFLRSKTEPEFFRLSLIIGSCKMVLRPFCSTIVF